MNQKWKTSVTTLLLVLIVNGNALASSIHVTVDPGAIGSVTGNLLTMELPNLIGIPLPRDETLIEVQFANAKYVTLSGLTAGDVFRYYVLGTYIPSTATFGLADGNDGEYSNEYALLDRIGQQVSSWDYVTVGGSGGSVGVFVEHQQSILDLEEISIHGIRLGVESSKSFQFTGATLNLLLMGTGTMQIGIIPEPSTLALAALLISLILGRRRKTL